MEGIIVVWIFFAFLVGVAASKYGKSGFLWFVISIIVSPLVASIALIVFLLPSKDKATTGSIAAVDHPLLNKQCPSCAEVIKLEALKCKHCGAEFDEAGEENEHIFTIKCDNCKSENEIRRTTIHHFPYCSSCGKPMLDINSITHREGILRYLNTNKDQINDVVYWKIRVILNSAK